MSANGPGRRYYSVKIPGEAKRKVYQDDQCIYRWKSDGDELDGVPVALEYCTAYGVDGLPNFDASRQKEAHDKHMNQFLAAYRAGNYEPSEAEKRQVLDQLLGGLMEDTKEFFR